MLYYGYTFKPIVFKTNSHLGTVKEIHPRSPEDCPMAFMTGPSGLPTEGLLFIGWFIGLLCGGPQFMIPPPELQTIGLLWGPSGLPMPGPQFIGPQFIGPMGLPIGAPQFIGLPPI